MFVEHVPDDRGQAHTLEAFTASLLLVAGLVFATQATAVTPLSASTSNQHIENQQAIAAGDVLSTTNERGDLKRALLYWNATERGFIGGNDRGYYTELSAMRDETDPAAANPLYRPLREAFNASGVAFDVVVRYPDDGQLATQSVVDMGEPTDNAATASVRVPLYTDDRLVDRTGDETTTAVSETEYFAPPDATGSETLYTVVEVRITAWQM